VDGGIIHNNNKLWLELISRNNEAAVDEVYATI
jgi:hypothetical protein